MKKIISFLLVLAMAVSVAVMPASAASADVEIFVGSADCTTTGKWETVSSLKGPNGEAAWYANSSGESTVTYSALSLDAGVYEVFYYKNVHTAKNDNALPLTIVSDEGTKEVVIDCSVGDTGYESIGTFTFSGIDGQGVTATRKGKNDSIVTRTAAVKFKPIKLMVAPNAMSTMISETEFYTYSLFNYIGINSIDFIEKENQITRAEFLAAVINALGLNVAGGGDGFVDVTAEHMYYNEITGAKNSGIVNGDGSGYFKPDEPIRSEEAAKIMVAAIDKLPGNEQYTVVRAENSGGFKEGYLSVAASLGLLRNVNISAADSYLKMSDAVTVIMNLLETEITKMYSDGKTVPVIEEIHKIYKGKGIVNAVYGMSVSAGAFVAEGYTEIDNKRYQLGGITADSYLGANVNYYYYAPGNGDTDAVVAIMKNSSTRMVEIPAGEIENAVYSTASGEINIEYYKNDSSLKTEAVDAAAKVYYNGILINDRTASDFKPGSGSVVLVSNNGDKQYEYAFINSYTNFYVKSVNKNDEVVYDKFTNAELKFESYKDGYKIVKDGKESSVDKIRENDILRIPAERANTAMPSYAEIILTRNSVSGVIKKQTSEEITIEEEIYELSKSYADVIASIEKEQAKVKVGNLVTVYLDADGKIAAVEEGDVAEVNYAYVKAMSVDDSSETIKINTFLETGVWEILTLKESITYTANDITSKIRSEAIVNEDTFIGDLSAFRESYHFYPENPTGWDTTSGLKVSDGSMSSPWSTREAASYTYGVTSIPAGEYEIMPYIVVHSNSGVMKITVTHANGTQSFNISQSEGSARWLNLGVYEFTGSPEEGVTFSRATPGDTKPIRLGDIKFSKQVDVEQLFRDANVPVEKVIEYKKNTDGLVSSIKVLENTSSTTNTRYKNLAGNVFLSAGNKGVDFTVDSNTVIFNIPGSNEKDEYAIVPLGAFGHDATYNTWAYGEDENRYAPVMIVRDFYANALSDQIAVGTMVVKSAITTIDSNQEVRKAIEVFDGKNSQLHTATRDEDIDGIDFGDLIAMSFDQNNEAHYVNHIYDFDGTFTPGSVGNAISRYGCYYGRITDVVNDGYYLFISTDGSNLKETSELVILTSPTVIICDTDKELVENGSLSDIQPNDFVAVRTDIQRGRMVVIYR